MARRVVSLGISTLLVGALAAGAATAGTPVTYRNGTVVATDAEHHTLAVDLGDGVVQLRAVPGVDVAALRSGDSVLVGIGEVEGRTQAVYVRTAASSMPAVTSSAGMTEPAPGAPRRPVYVITNRNGRPPDDADSDEATRFEKVRASAIVETPAEPVPAASETASPEPSRLELAREDGRRQMISSLELIDPLVREVDRAWMQYVAGCPGAGDVRARGWLSLAPEATAPAGACSELLASVRKTSAAVRQRLAQIEENARASSVTPGTLREALERLDLPR